METHGILKAFPKVKRYRTSEDGPPLKKTSVETVTGNVFQGLFVYIVPAGIGKARCDIFHQQIVQNGGQVEASFSPRCTHVVVDETVDGDRALRLLRLKTLPPAVQLVKSSWLSSCISERKLLCTKDYRLLLLDSDLLTHAEEPQESVLGTVTDPQETVLPPNWSAAPADPAVMTQETQGEHLEEDGVSQNDLEALISGVSPAAEEPVAAASDASDTASDKALEKTEKTALPGKWVCAQSSEAKAQNHNKHITDKLEQLAKAYTSTGDKWRALSYSKAINALKSHPSPVTTYEEAFSIPGIGKAMACKVVEIMESGTLRKLDNFGEAVTVLECFTNVWGAGAKTAQLWYQQGYRTLEDIHTKATLSHVQRIGLKHYDDFLDRMPRCEAAAIEETVRKAALSVNPDLLVVACGSYRRGKPTCGDVDVLITHPDGRSHEGVFSRVLSILHKSGFLTDDLVSHEENGEQKKYMGVCRLPGASRRHRRLDVIVVPHQEFACSLLYFTGSAHFNRSMRALAKTKGMSLSEHSLNCNVVRQRGVKVTAGKPMHTPTESNVFQLLGIPYREPQERDW